MSVNMYCGAQYEYKQGVVKKLLDEGIIDFCLTDYIPDDREEKPQSDARIVAINHDFCDTGMIEEQFDINSIPALDKSLMESLLPYESMGIKLGMRYDDCQVVEYEEGKRNFFIQLRVWNYLFDKYSINFCFLNDVPHIQGKYAAYALAKVKNIKVLIMCPSPIETRRVFGFDINSLGANIYADYLKMKNEVVEISLDDDVADFLENRIAMMKKRAESGVFMQDKKYIKKNKSLSSQQNLGYISGLYSYWRKKLLLLYKSFVDTRSMGEYRERINHLRIERRRVFARSYWVHNLTYDLSDYDKLACIPDYSKKYIYYPLQFTPEATTMPSAGVFSEQYTAIQLLAQIADKLGLFVYVKEHYMQTYRSKSFYEDIRMIPNVCLIKLSEPTYNLMKNSTIVATQTGTSLVEAPLMKKPAFAIGDGYHFKGLPGIYEIDSIDQGVEVLKGILENSVDIPDEDLRLYFYAIQKNTIKDMNGEETVNYLLGKGGGIDKSDHVIASKVNMVKHSLEGLKLL